MHSSVYVKKIMYFKHKLLFGGDYKIDKILCPLRVNFTHSVYRTVRQSA